MSILDIRSYINNAGGVANPSRFAFVITPPKIFSSSALNTTPSVGQFAFDSDLPPDQVAQQSAAYTGQPVQNFGLRPNYFKSLGVDQIDITRLDFMCMKANLPGRSFDTTPARTYGSKFDMPFMDVYSDVSGTFIVGKDMYERNFFDAWCYTIQDPETSDFNYVDEYATTIDIYQMDEFDKSTYACRLFQAWPKTIGELNLSYDQRNTFHTFTVTFTYRKWINLLLETNTPTSIDPANSPPQSFSSTISGPSK